ncbi:TetR/AcrR family transcriptional regulator [Jongsikchunia kroppenstedtii]|uniref:TetR/AcrR family transcriptional regulator n=1 Tax=Jongsikchunia kroppenstedtii TaxID=1121721 RepID=UPI0003A6DDCA|nr:TetR/AcrR family transcriptional regulator [Jongsikchunia kroppenstedtii]
MPRSDRESLIIDAATAEFGKSGYSGTQVTRIAGDAGVSKALVLSYFGSKDKLFVACVDGVGSRLTAAIADTMTTTSADDSDIGAIAVLATIFATLADRPTDWHLLFDRTVRAGVAADAAHEQRQALRLQAAAGATRALQILGLRDADDLSAASMIWENSVSALVEWWLQHPDETAQQMTDRARRLISALAGISR